VFDHTYCEPELAGHLPLHFALEQQQHQSKDHIYKWGSFIARGLRGCADICRRCRSNRVTSPHIVGLLSSEWVRRSALLNALKDRSRKDIARSIGSRPPTEFYASGLLFFWLIVKPIALADNPRWGDGGFARWSDLVLTLSGYKNSTSVLENRCASYRRAGHRRTTHQVRPLPKRHQGPPT
jgi:hypothetical protein